MTVSRAEWEDPPFWFGIVRDRRADGKYSVLIPELGKAVHRWPNRLGLVQGPSAMDRITADSDLF